MRRTLTTIDTIRSDSVPYIANCSRWKSFVDGQGTSNLLENFRSLFTLVKMCSHAYTISLIERIWLIILNNYMYHLTCRFLSLADIARQCGCKDCIKLEITQCSLSYSFGNADAQRANRVDT